MSLYSAYDSASHRLRIDYSYSNNAAARTFTISANATIENLNTNQLDIFTAKIYIGGLAKTVSIGPGAWEGNVSVYMGSYSRTFNYDSNGNGSATVQGQLLSGTGGSGGWTNSTNVTVPNIPAIVPPAATVAWMDNFTVPNYMNVGIDNPSGATIEAYIYINGAPVVSANGITGTFTWYLSEADNVAILNAIGPDVSSNAFTLYLRSYLNGTDLGTGTKDGICYKPAPNQVTLSKTNFTIGENIIIWSNRVNYQSTHKITVWYSALNKIIASDITDAFTWDTDANQDLYLQMPASNTGWGTIVLQTYYSGVLIGQTTQRFDCAVANSNPIFSNFTYIDSNALTFALTNNNQKIVKGYSNVKATISTANKAMALNSATMNKYIFKNGTKPQIDGTYSSSANVDITINGVDATTMEVYATDSRGNSTKKEIIASTFLDYFPINVLAGTATRGTGGIGTAVTLAFNGSLWNKTFGSIMNSIISCIYKYKKTTDTVWTTGTTVITPAISGDTYSKSASIIGDLGASGFNSSYSYNIQVIITDKLSTFTQNITLQSGKPQLAIPVGKGVAFGNFYIDAEGGDIQVLGKDILNLIWPIGRGFTDYTDTDYSSYCGFTWVKTTIGKMQVGKDGSTEFHDIGQVGGVKTVTLDSTMIPSLDIYVDSTPVLYNGTGGSTAIKPTASYGANATGSSKFIAKGGGLPHNNLPPYEVVNFWKRTI